MQDASVKRWQFKETKPSHFKSKIFRITFSSWRETEPQKRWPCNALTHCEPIFSRSYLWQLSRRLVWLHVQAGVVAHRNVFFFTTTLWLPPCSHHQGRGCLFNCQSKGRGHRWQKLTTIRNHRIGNGRGIIMLSLLCRPSDDATFEKWRLWMPVDNSCTLLASRGCDCPKRCATLRCRSLSC